MLSPETVELFNELLQFLCVAAMFIGMFVLQKLLDRLI